MSNIEDSFIVLEETPSMLQYSVLDSTDIVENLTNKFYETSTELNQTAKNDSSKSSLSHETPLPPKTTTLAQLFLLGDIDCDKIKSYLPSLINSNKKEDVKKWENLIKERNDLKDALQRTNATMREQHSIVNNWQNGVKTLKENNEKELNKFRKINDELFQQNYDLQTRVAELQDLADLSCKTCIQSEKERCSAGMKERLEEQIRQEEIRSLKLELANKIAMNVEIEESQEEMKVKLFAIQELFQNATNEIAVLKKKNECFQRELEEAKALIVEYREKASMIQTQCDVFKNDFEIERKQREEMASEQDIHLADIRMLRKRNQALIDEAHAYYNETSAASLTSIVSNVNIFICPLCSVAYEKITDLESHVQNCLESC